MGLGFLRRLAGAARPKHHPRSDEVPSGVPRRLSRRVRVLLGVSGGVLLLAAGAGVVFVKASDLAAAVTARALPTLSQRLGLEMRMGRLEAEIWPRPAVRISDFFIGRSGEPTLLTAKTLHATVALWPFLSSFGADVQLTSVVIDGARMAFVRRSDGSWNGLQLAHGLLRSASLPSPLLVVHRATVRAATVDVYDVASGAQSIGSLGPAEIEMILSPTGAKTPADPSGVSASATLRAHATIGSDRPNVVATLTLSTRQSVAAGAAPEVRGTVALERIDLARAKPWVPAALQRVAQDGTLTAQLAIDTNASGVLSTTGSGSIERITLLDQPAAVSFSVDAKLNANSPGPLELALPSVTIDHISLASLQARDLRARASLRGSTFVAEQAVATFCGAPVSVGQVTLSPDGSWGLTARIEKLSLVEFGRTAGLRVPLSGHVTARIDSAAATGFSWDAIRKTLSGTGRFDVEQAQLTGDMVTAVTRPITNALASAGLPSTLLGELGVVPATMPVEPFGAGFRVADGRVHLTEALSLRTKIVDVVLTGHIGLDQSLSLTGHAKLHPGAFGSTTVGAARARGVPITLRGTFSDPVVEVSATPAQIVALLADSAPTMREVGDGAVQTLKDWLRRR